MTGGRTAPRLAMVVLVCLACGIVLAGTAHAQDDPAALDAEVERLYQTGNYADAKEIANRSLAIREKALGPDHPDVAFSINNLAEVYRMEGRFADAEQHRPTMQRQSTCISAVSQSAKLRWGPGTPMSRHH